ncbi:MarR family transcriptional regulator [Microbacterium sp.]|uniref:MarR family winged helix-turn-helix transcriptional regulator n=1 Tax=Microbacterium sp. TaxID=51671 RepID=UPI002BB159BE|nr:MarR family transcriptional regulator [Microbacterium sp.]HWK76964.1 MarR family transcriptional regulator [Microbacterium sp.]
MSNENPDPAEAIAHALSRLRGRRSFGPRAHGHGHGGPHGEHGPHEHGTHEHDRGFRGAPGFGPGIGAPPWAGVTGGPGGRLGGPAWIRMLDALAAASEPLSVSALGEAIGVDQPRASRLVQQGVQRGLVQREADPEDGRRTRIALTDEGRRIARGMRGERREVLSKALESFTDEEKNELARLLAKLADNWT